MCIHLKRIKLLSSINNIHNRHTCTFNLHSYKYKHRSAVDYIPSTSCIYPSMKLEIPSFVLLSVFEPHVSPSDQYHSAKHTARGLKFGSSLFVFAHPCLRC